MEEASALLELRTAFALGGIHDMRGTAEAARLGGLLTPAQLLDLRDTVEGMVRAQRTVQSLSDRLPLLGALVEQLPECGAIAEEVNRSIGPRGEVLDTASALLASLRKEVRQSHDRLNGYLTDLLSSERGRTVLQEPLVTLRNGRYVVPVKADFRGEFQGIIHDLSSSGATVFMEPIAAVALGNKWRESQLAEEREVERVLRELSTLVGDYAPEIETMVTVLAHLDLVLAKAKYGVQVRGIAPGFRREGDPSRVLKLERARHPLLRRDAVPLSLELGSDFTILVITGPNTGGKTVALKTVGLLVLMAQAGIPTPVGEGTTFPVFREVFADIGDEQSIEQSLSTFSSHMSNIIAIMERLSEDCLVLLDELGAGTEPAEGSALARAMLSHLLEQNVHTIVTTHHSDLKAYAHTTPGVRNASMEFDAETLGPTYRLTVGVPGRSNALAIAGRLGLPKSLLDAARGLMGPESLQVDQLLLELQQERDAASQARAEAELTLTEALALRQERQAMLDRIQRDKEGMVLEAQQQLMRRVQDMESTLHRAEQDIQRALQEQRRDELVAAAAALQETEQRAANLEKRIIRRRRPQPAAEAPVLTPGALVRLKGLGQTAEVVSGPSSEGEVQVLLGSFRATVQADQLESAEGAAPPAERRPARVTYAGPSVPLEAVDLELHLRGMRVEEALGKLEEYLDQAFRAGMPFARIIHGRGTGVMRRAARELLTGHPLVRSFETPPQDQGGEGVTIVHFNQ